MGKSGLIEGSNAKRYAERISKRTPSIEYDSFISSHIKGNKVIVDLCCGPGNDIELLKERARRIIGIDGSNEMIKICKKKFSKDKNVEIIKADAEKTGLDGKMADYALIRMGLHHVQAVKEVLEEARRILKDDGKLIVIDKVLLGNSKVKSFLYEIYLLLTDKNPDVFYHHHYTEKMLSEALAPFEVKEKANFPYDDYRGKIWRRFGLVLAKKA